MEILLKDLLLAYAAVNCLGALVTYIDKRNVRFNINRIPNWVLMAVGICGGAAGMLLAMKVMHHKTRYKRFMIGLPLIIVGHLLLFVWMTQISQFFVIVLEALPEY